MGKIEQDPAADLVSGDKSSVDEKDMSLKQLKLLVRQLRESRDNSEAMLVNLRSELDILRKNEIEKAKKRKETEEQEQERHQQKVATHPTLQNKKDQIVATAPSPSPIMELSHEAKEEILRLERELLVAKNQVLTLQRENDHLRRHSSNISMGGTTTGSTIAGLVTESGDDEGEIERTDNVEKEMRRMKKKINRAVRQSELLKKKKEYLEHELRISRFREDEAVVFLRRIRSFYFMIWRNNVVRGSGGYQVNRIAVVPSDSTQQPAGAADEKMMLELDKLMVESGLLEKDEMGKDTPDDKRGSYRPSRTAFGRSTNVAAEIAKRNAIASSGGGSVGGHSAAGSIVSSGKRWGGGGGMEVPSPIRGPLSAVNPVESPKAIDARQKLDGTPAGRFIALREKYLEAELTKQVDQIMELEKELDAERKKKDSPGSDSELAEEANVLRKQLQTKEGDLRMIVQKLRESSVLNWKIHETSQKQQEHIKYLEKRLGNYRERLVPTALPTRKDTNATKLGTKLANSSKLKTQEMKLRHVSTADNESSKDNIQAKQDGETTTKDASNQNNDEMLKDDKTTEEEKTNKSPNLDTKVQLAYSDVLACEKVLARQQQKETDVMNETNEKVQLGQDVTAADDPNGEVDSHKKEEGGEEAGDDEDTKGEESDAVEELPEFVHRRRQIFEEEEDDEGDEDENADLNDLDSSSMSTSASSKNIPREMRGVVAMISPQVEWRRKKEAEKSKEKNRAGFSRPGVKSDSSGPESDENRPAWMQKLKPKADSTKPSWMNSLKRKGGGSGGGGESSSGGEEPPWNKFRKKKGAKEPAEEEDTGEPEFFRKFKKIGIRNAAETVVTYDGTSGQSNDGRATYGAKDEGNSNSIHPNNDIAQISSASEFELTPKPLPEPQLDVPAELDPEIEAKTKHASALLEVGGQHIMDGSYREAADTFEAAFAQVDAALPGSDLDSDSSSVAATSPALPLPPPTKKSSILDSDSSSDSDSPPMKVSPAPAPAPTLASSSKISSFLETVSDSDSSDSSPPKKAVPPPKKSSFLDSDSDSDSS